MPKLCISRWLSAFVDAVNISAVVLTAGVTVALERTTPAPWQAWAVGLGKATLPDNHGLANAGWSIWVGCFFEVVKPL